MNDFYLFIRKFSVVCDSQTTLIALKYFGLCVTDRGL
jgi:hypothetical protein